jgi:hypothetical protein
MCRSRLASLISVDFNLQQQQSRMSLIFTLITKRPKVLLGDSKWLWINMATMYANLCGNCVGGVELIFV